MFGNPLLGAHRLTQRVARGPPPRRSRLCRHTSPTKAQGTGRRGSNVSVEAVQVQTATESEADARRIGRAAVERRLAACAQIVPIGSIYRWRGEVVEATEWLCLLKTQRGLYRQLEGVIRSLHPYEEPEIVAVPISDGSRGYLDWVADSTQGREGAADRSAGGDALA
jgi:periplasmic divalent cation tolerance protein